MFRSKCCLLLLLVTAALADAGRKNPSYIYPESAIANVSLEGFLADRSHYSAVVYLSGSFSTSYYVPATSRDPAGYVSDGRTNDKRFFVLAEAALDSSKADEIELPTRKELEEAAFSDAPSKYRGHVVIVIAPLGGKAKGKAFMRGCDGKFASVKLRELEELLTSLCDKRIR